MSRYVKMLWTIAISISYLFFPQIFPMHAEDDRYANFFLATHFTEREVETLCDNHSQVCGPFMHPLFIQSLSLVKY